MWLSAGISFLLHAVLAAVLAVIVVNYTAPSPEFVELNVGRISRDELARLVEEAERAAETSPPDRRARTPARRLPRIDMPTISPSEAERRLLPERVALEAEKAPVLPPRPARSTIPSLPPSAGERKVLYEGARIDLGPRPGEGIESEHVGSDIHPVFLIEGEVRGRKFYEAAVTQVPEMPADTRIQLDVAVAPSGAIISAIVVRRENASLEEFATSYLRRSRFDPLPDDLPQVNQTGRITITFTARH